MKKYQDKLEDILADTTVAESAGEYINAEERNPFINPLVDWAFKRIFASEANKGVAKAFLNEVLRGRREIVSIAYGKNEYPGEIKGKRGAVLDFVCKDQDGVSFLVELQRQEQPYFKDRSLFYASRLISDQGSKGKDWNYELKAVYVICLLEKSSFLGTAEEMYLHDVSLINTRAGAIFNDKLHFVYIELDKFNKTESMVETGLDKWIYSLKNAGKMTTEPVFAEEMNVFFESARCANLTKEELDMYRTAQEEQWDNQNAFNFAMEKAMKAGREVEKKMMVLEMLKSGIDVAIIAVCSRLSVEEIIALK